MGMGCWPAAVEQFTSWVASARRRDRTVQTASEDVSVCARLRRLATFLFIGALEAYLLTYLLTYVARNLSQEHCEIWDKLGKNFLEKGSKLVGLGEHCKLPSRVQGGAPTTDAFWTPLGSAELRFKNTDLQTYPWLLLNSVS